MSPFSFPTLPGEMTDSIIDYLADDWRSLAKCALVCCPCRARAQHHLSRGITLTIAETTKAQAVYPDLCDFLRTFCTGPPLSDLITALTMNGAARRTATYARGALPHDVNFSPLRNLWALILRDLHVSTPAAFRTLYMSFPVLEELSVDGVSTDRVARRDLWPQGHVGNTATHVLREDLLLSSLSATVRTLHIDFPKGYLFGWDGTMKALQGTLRELRLHVWPAPNAVGVSQSSSLSRWCMSAHLCRCFMSEWHSPAFYDATAGCAHLRSLTLHVSPWSELASSRTPRSRASARRSRSGSRPLRASSHPYPLREFALRRGETVATVGRALCAERFPSLTRVRVSIWDESASVSLEEQRKDLEELAATLRGAQRAGGGGVAVEVYAVLRRGEWEKECM
ncbi:hypothetical protein BV20DRAFT_124057 [Pilatotrama ljubarskyi]|nr:hypothetical protein BV20DRAFT_124057 [Pilatotrama ljubarskyi]